ncbi:hypothetical protein D3C85_1015630 [compost metagenome]
MDRRVGVVKIPLICRQLAIRMHVPFFCKYGQLLFGKIRIYQRQTKAMKAQVPGGIPGKFPFIRHGNDVCIVDVFPVQVTGNAMTCRRGHSRRVAFQPTAHAVIVKLLVPE